LEFFEKAAFFGVFRAVLTGWLAV